MRLLVLTLAALLSAFWTAWAVQTYGGEVIVHLEDFSLKVSLLMALLIALTVLFGFYFLVWSSTRLLELPGRLRHRTHERQHHRARRLFLQGLRQMLEEHWKEASRSFEQAARAEPKSAMIRLFAARAQLELNDPKQWEPHLRAIEDPDFRQSVAMLRAEGLIRRQEWEEALAVLEQAPEHNQPSAATVHALIRCHEALRSWSRLLTLYQTPAITQVLPQKETIAGIRRCIEPILEQADDAAREQLWARLDLVTQADEQIAAAFQKANQRAEHPGA